MSAFADRLRKPGRALQSDGRTTLAWRRTGLSLLVGSLTIGRLTLDTIGAAVVIPTAITAVLALWIVAVALRERRLARDHPGVGVIERDRFRVVLLDEYQDTSHAQVVLLNALFGGGHPVTAVGDPCQSIYGWRGASAGTLDRFPTEFARTDGSPADSGIAASEMLPPEKTIGTPAKSESRQSMTNRKAGVVIAMTRSMRRSLYLRRMYSASAADASFAGRRSDSRYSAK